MYVHVIAPCKRERVYFDCNQIKLLISTTSLKCNELNLERCVVTIRTRQHSSRMLTARLLTVRVVAVATRCQYCGWMGVPGPEEGYPSPLVYYLPPGRDLGPGIARPLEGTWDKAYTPPADRQTLVTTLPSTIYRCGR